MGAIIILLDTHLITLGLPYPGHLGAFLVGFLESARESHAKDCYQRRCLYDPLLGSAQVAADKKKDEVD